jgi:hypothetical protein
LVGLDVSESLPGELLAGVKFLILFFRIRRPPRFEPPSMHSRFSRTQRVHGGLPGLPLESLHAISAEQIRGKMIRAEAETGRKQ